MSASPWEPQPVDEEPPPEDPGPPEPDVEPMHHARTWQPLDPTPVLDGTWTQPEPTVGLRTDGIPILYPGKQHVAQGETESGKSWFASCITATELTAGHHVVVLDFEDDINTAVGRLRLLQVPDAIIRSQFHYVRPIEPLGTGINLDDLGRLLHDTKPTTVILDGITEAMTMHGLDPLSNKDVATFGRMLPKKIADQGPAVLSLDHVVKNGEARGKYALGGVHKLNALDGAAFIIENRTPFGVGITGRSTIKLAKDRPGQLRRRSLPSKSGLHWFGDLVLTSHNEDFAELAITAPTERDENFRPTTLMAKVWKVIELHDHGAGLSQRKVQDLAKGNATNNRSALTYLEVDGFITPTPHKTIKPYPPTDGENQ